MPKRARPGPWSDGYVSYKRAKTTVVVAPKKKKPMFALPRSLSAFPAKKKAMLKYVQTTVLNPGPQQCLSELVRLNGMYDPDGAVAFGHQPYGFDTYMSMYKYYHVISCRVKASFMGTTKVATGSAGWRVMLHFSDSTNAITTAASADSMMERPYSKYKQLEAGNGPATLSLKWDAAKWFGCEDVLDNERLQGSVGTVPTEQAFGVVTVTNGDNGADDPAPVSVIWEIDYEVMFTDLITQAAS